MREEHVELSPGEVRAVARFPHRSRLGVGALALLALSALLFLGRGPLPEPVPEVALFDPFACADALDSDLRITEAILGMAPAEVHDEVLASAVCAPDPDLCRARLPSELQRLPLGVQYAVWRTHDVVSALVRPIDPRQVPSEDRWMLFFAPQARPWPTEEKAQRQVEQELAGIDGWARQQLGLQLGLRFAPPQPDPDKVREALIALGAERDWTARPPPLDDLPGTAELDAMGLSADEADLARRALLRTFFIRKEARALADVLSRKLDRQRQALFEDTWRRTALDEARQELGWLLARRRVAERWVLYSVLSLAAGLSGAVLGALWAWLGPREVAVRLHHVQIGRHTIPWSEAPVIDWSGPVQVRARGRTHTLGLRTLSPAAIAALEQAAARAKERNERLDPLDPSSLAKLRRILE